MEHYELSAQPETEQISWSVKHWSAVTDLSPAFVYELLSSGKIEAVKVGGKRLIVTPPRAFLASLGGETA